MYKPLPRHNDDTIAAEIQSTDTPARQFKQMLVRKIGQNDHRTESITVVLPILDGALDSLNSH